MVDDPHTAGTTFQASGVHFTMSHAPISPLMTSDALPQLHFERDTTPLWDASDWEAASLLGRDVDEVEGSWAELRQRGDELWYSTQWHGALRIGPRTITGYPWTPASMLPLEMEFLELGLAFYLNARDTPVFHGAAIAVEDAAIALLASSGSGKSSLALAFVQHGHGFLSDDVVAVHGPEMLVYPGHYHMRLHVDTATTLLPSHLFTPLFPRYPRTKYVTDVRKWGTVQTTPVPLRAIYVVEASSTAAEIQITTIQGYQALQTLIAHELGRFGARHPARLAALAAVLRSVPIRKVTYPRCYTMLEQVVQTVVKDAGRTSTQRRTIIQ